MNWQNLKKSRCPKCNSYLNFKNKPGEHITCTNFSCQFSIAEDRMQDIVNNMVNEDLEATDNSHFREEGWG